jgi:hypothetical protein
MRKSTAGHSPAFLTERFVHRYGVRAGARQPQQASIRGWRGCPLPMCSVTRAVAASTIANSAARGVVPAVSQNSRQVALIAFSGRCKQWPGLSLRTGGERPSAFVEDSTFLGNSPTLINRLADLLEKTPLDIRFGGQLTIDQILSKPANSATLRTAGFDYLFFGLETLSPEELSPTSKNVGRKRGSWKSRAEQVFELASDLKTACGVAVY